MFTVINRNNVGVIGAKLLFKRGYILIAEPGTGCSGDVLVSLFRHPKILGGSIVSSNLRKNREYFLRITPSPSGDETLDFCRSLSETLTVGFYQFKIGYNATSSTGVLSNRKEGVSIYIPAFSDLEEAFTFGLQYVINRMHYSSEKGQGEHLPIVTKDNIRAMVAYALEDLKTGKVFRNNIAAGQEADLISESSMQRNFLSSLRS